MSNEHTGPRSLEKKLEQHKDNDKSLAGAEIKTTDDNMKQALIKRRDGLGSFKLTRDGQSSFTIVDDEKREHKDSRPLRGQDQMEAKFSESKVGLPGAVDAPVDQSRASDQVAQKPQVQQDSQRQGSAEPSGRTSISDKAPDASNKALERESDKAPDKAPDKASDKASDKAPDNVTDKTQSSPKAQAEHPHPWEDKRRQQLIDGYKISNPHDDPEKLADAKIKATKQAIENEVKLRTASSEATQQKALEAEYIKQGKTPEQASEAAKAEIKSTHDQTVARISEQVEHFEFTRREQLQSYLKHRMDVGKDKDSAFHSITEAEKSIAAGDEQLATDVARFETARRSELEANRLTGKETPQQIEKIKKEVDQEIEQTYKNVYDLMKNECTWKPGMNVEQRQQLAGDIMHQVSDTTDIKQGHHETCNATTIEVTTYSRHPAKAAALVEEVALHATYTVDGKTYSMPHENLAYHTKADGAAPRSFASQIFETTAVNLYLARHKPGTFYYETDQLDTTTDDGGRIVFDPKDTGERIKDAKGQVILKNSPGEFAAPGNFMEIQQLITGEEGTVLSTVDRPKLDHGRVQHVHSVEELRNQLEIAKAQHKFPITVEIDISHEPIGGGGRTGSHVVTIRGYDPNLRDPSKPKSAENPENPRIFIDNQWDSSKDHLQGLDPEHKRSQLPLTLGQLFDAMTFPKPIPAPLPPKESDR